MNDAEITAHIIDLVAEEQCWDLLRQRRARRNAGQEPNDAEVREADTVEHYQQ